MWADSVDEFQHLQDQIHQNMSRIEGINARLRRLEVIESAMAQMYSELTSLRSVAESQNTRITSLETEVSMLQRLAQQQDRFVRVRLRQVGSTTADLVRRLDDLYVGVHAIAAGRLVAPIATSGNAVAISAIQRVESMGDRLRALQARVELLDARFDALVRLLQVEVVGDFGNRT